MILPAIIKFYPIGEKVSSERYGENREMKKKNILFFILLAAVACVLACFVNDNTSNAKALVEVEISAESGSEFKIYWAGPGQLFSEERAASIVTAPHTTNYSFLLTDIGKVDRLRIDTHTYIGSAQVHSLRITQQGYKPILLNSAEQFSLLKPLHDIYDIEIKDGVLQLYSSGMDPNLELPVHHGFWGLERRRTIIQYIAICFLVILVCWFFQSLLKELRTSTEKHGAQNLSIRSKIGIGVGIAAIAVGIAVALGDNRSDGTSYPAQEDLVEVWSAQGVRTDRSDSYTGTYTLNSGGAHKYDISVASGGRKTGNGSWYHAPESYRLRLKNDTGSLYHGYFASEDFTTITLITDDGRWKLTLEKM